MDVLEGLKGVFRIFIAKTIINNQRLHFKLYQSWVGKSIQFGFA